MNLQKMSDMIPAEYQGVRVFTGFAGKHFHLASNLIPKMLQALNKKDTSTLLHTVTNYDQLEHPPNN